MKREESEELMTKPAERRNLWYQSFIYSNELEDPSMASMPSSTSSFQPPSNLSLVISNLSSFVTVKLDINDFLIWKNQWHNILRAAGLIFYIDESVATPSDFIKYVANVDVVNPDFT